MGRRAQDELMRIPSGGVLLHYRASGWHGERVTSLAITLVCALATPVTNLGVARRGSTRRKRPPIQIISSKPASQMRLRVEHGPQAVRLD